MDGLPFVTAARFRHAVAGLVIDVQDRWGREALVAWSGAGPGAC